MYLPSAQRSLERGALEHPTLGVSYKVGIAVMVWSGKKGLEIVGDIRNYVSIACTKLLALRSSRWGSNSETRHGGTVFRGAGGRCCHWTRRQGKEWVGRKRWGELKILLKNGWSKNTMCKICHPAYHLSLQLLPLMLVHPFKIGIWRLFWWEKSSSLLPFGVSNGTEKSDCLCLGSACICHGL